MQRRHSPASSAPAKKTEDDAATQILGEGWRTPTADEWEELFANCTCEAAVVGEVSGFKLKSKNNDNWIFLPCTGKINMYDFQNQDMAFFWSVSYSTEFPFRGDAAFIDGKAKTYTGSSDRCSGFQVRAVRK